MASRRWCGVNLRGLPISTPRALARSRPSPVRLRISSRSNSERRPGIPQRLEAGALVGDGAKQVEKVFRRPGEAIKPVTTKTSSLPRRPDVQAGQLFPVRLCAADLLLEYLGAARRLQLRYLRRQRLAVGRYSSVAQSAISASIFAPDLCTQ